MTNKKLLYGAAGLLMGGAVYFLGVKKGRSLANYPPQNPSQNLTDRDMEFACELLDLPKIGSFTQDDLKVHYKELLITFHPDKFMNLAEKAHAEKVCLWAGWSKQVVEKKMGWAT